MIRKDLRDKRAALLTQNRGLTELATTDKRELTGEELTQFEARMADVDRLSKQIGLEERQANAEAEREKPKERDDATNENMGCRNFGEFIYKVRFEPREFQDRAYSMGSGPEGGFAVPTQFRPELLALTPEDAIVRPRATVIPAGDPPDAAMTMPALDQGAAGVYGGVAVTWISEGGAKPETTGALLEVSLTPNEVAAHIVVTDKLLRNWEAADALLKKLLRQAMLGAEDYKFLRGNGSGAPQGILTAACAIAITRNTASTVKFVDVATMMGRLNPESLNRAVWVASITVLPQLIQMATDSGSVSTVFIQGDVTKKISSTLFGLPIIFTGRLPVLGTAGDLVLADFSQYLIKDGSGPFVAASPHVHFLNNKTVIKAFWNVDGDAWWAAPLELEDGTTTVSPFVILT